VRLPLTDHERKAGDFPILDFKAWEITGFFNLRKARLRRNPATRSFRPCARRVSFLIRPRGLSL